MTKQMKAIKKKTGHISRAMAESINSKEKKRVEGYKTQKDKLQHDAIVHVKGFVKEL